MRTRIVALIYSWRAILADQLRFLADRIDYTDFPDAIDAEALHVQISAYAWMPEYQAGRRYSLRANAETTASELHQWAERFHSMLVNRPGMNVAQVHGDRDGLDSGYVIVDETHRWAPRESLSAEHRRQLEDDAPEVFYLDPSVPLREDQAAPDLAEGLDSIQRLMALGAEVTPDLDAYAAGELDASQIRCVLCTHAPCTCQRCVTCGFTKQAKYNGCPRGCAVQ